MQTRQSMSELVQDLKQDENIVHWHTMPGQPAKTRPFPNRVNESIKQTLKNRGIDALYSHQADALQHAMNHESFVAVTPTASGKTLCYNLPVLQSLVEDDNRRALYLFPTKALAQDQKSEMNEMIDDIGIPLKSYTYDGDTPGNIRQKVRQAGHIVITNPDMLHSSILPHHTKWVSLFENLHYIVIDELHTYRGVFGSHVANVIRRLKRICRYYGSDPVFVCTSATIANPKEHAEQLTGERMRLIDTNGAPSVRKHFAFYNPPVVNQAMNVRRSATLEVQQLAKQFLQNQIQTIVFARSRVRVELLLSYMQSINTGRSDRASIRAYRGGYLPSERRDIERGLRSGDIQGVVSTNALELGVDIGQLQACIMTGYPGSISSAWQQAGRAGRRQDEAVIVLVATSSPLDQYIIQHPDYFFNRNPESARINANNLIILVDHIKCAAYELPFHEDDYFAPDVAVNEICTYLADEDVLHYQGGKWYWMNDAFPANNVSLRSASQENVVIIDQTDTAKTHVIGEMDRFSAMTLLHDEAIYIHQGEQYQVIELDWDEKKAYVKAVSVNYYTDANLAVQLDVLDIDKSKQHHDQAHVAYGDVTVRAKPTIFKKIRFDTHDNVGWGPIHLPEEETHTSSAWVSFAPELIDQFGKQRFEQALLGISHVLRHAAPLFVMCDPVDLQVVPKIKASHNEQPTIFIYDKYPGGIGLSDKLYENMSFLINEVEQMIDRCSCRDGCPSCIGTPDSDQTAGKSTVLALLSHIKEVKSCR
ncbi:DEAD/DEAH box helicase [Tuberibacillus sp. Marseille-P3662]|uniref:DEAD/DEAH box helicase n=1 Tax=Tuberibacillus sp. Marseille-P3662 TaxID=1965358 RepID=UPI000A1CB79F|nr:DEAD/DEAH box helicase [Tuberibacillus sp. Marseille-P3662]